MASYTPQVLISGAGPTGLVAALALLQNGINVRLIDKLTSYRVGFKGSGVTPRTLEVYNLLGVLPDILAKSGKIKAKKVYLPNGGTMTHDFINYIEDTPARPYNNPVMIGQDRHEDILREHLATRYDCHVELGVDLVSFEQTADRVVARLLHHLDNDLIEIFETPYLLGCDGAHSVVRKQLGLSFLGEGKLERPIVVGDIHVASSLDPQFWHIWGDRLSKFASMRAFETNDGRFNLSLGGPPEVTKAASENRESFIKAFVDITGRTDIVFGEMTWLSYFYPQARMVDTFSTGRVFVAGDAAHLHSPVGGQGLNTSVQDAFNIAWKLALVLKQHSPPSILSSYSSERLPVVAAMLDMVVNITKRITNDSQVVSLAQDIEVRQFGVNYRGSDIVIDEFAEEGEVIDPYRSGEHGTVRAGDRAPDAPGLRSTSGEMTSLFESVFGVAHHTLLIFGTTTTYSLVDRKDLVKAVVVLPQDSVNSMDGAVDVMVDTYGYAYKHYDVYARPVRYVVVRPDGVIGAIASKEATVEEYFHRIFV